MAKLVRRTWRQVSSCLHGKLAGVMYIDDKAARVRGDNEAWLEGDVWEESR